GGRATATPVAAVFRARRALSAPPHPETGTDIHPAKLDDGTSPRPHPGPARCARWSAPSRLRPALAPALGPLGAWRYPAETLPEPNYAPLPAAVGNAAAARSDRPGAPGGFVARATNPAASLNPADSNHCGSRTAPLRPAHSAPLLPATSVPPPKPPPTVASPHCAPAHPVLLQRMLFSLPNPA